MPARESVTFEQYEDVMRLPEWALVEDTFGGGHDPLGVPKPSTAAPALS
jgi:hypothetical protein